MSTTITVTRISRITAAAPEHTQVLQVRLVARREGEQRNPETKALSRQQLYNRLLSLSRAGTTPSDIPGQYQVSQ
jgi:hypothetical protein